MSAAVERRVAAKRQAARGIAKRNRQRPPGCQVFAVRNRQIESACACRTNAERGQGCVSAARDGWRGSEDSRAGASFVSQSSNQIRA